VSSPPILIRRTSPDAADAAGLLADYNAELLARGRPFSPLDPPAGSGGRRVEVHEMEPPGGTFLVALEDDVPVACGGLRTLRRGVGEIKRMYVAPGARGRGVGRVLLEFLEDMARDPGYAVARLDTGARQPRAQRMYERAGYAAVPDYNDNPYAAFWGEKRL
jgi:GNAT superfamily N-acetyltransferase